MLARISHHFEAKFAGPALVAQVSNLLYRRFPIGRVSKFGWVPLNQRDAGWKHCDTADWKSALRFVVRNAG